MRTLLAIGFILYITISSFAAHALTMDDIALREEAKLVRQHSIRQTKDYDSRLYTSVKKEYASNQELIFAKEIAEGVRVAIPRKPIDKSGEHYDKN